MSVGVGPGQQVAPGEELLVVEALKMQHVIAADAFGTVQQVSVGPGDTVAVGTRLLVIEGSDGGGSIDLGVSAVDIDAIRPDLAEVLGRQTAALDEARPGAVAKRRASGQRTARENIADLCDTGTFVEYGRLALPADTRRPVEQMIERYPADGLITGLGSVNGTLFDESAARCAILAYDYTVLAGTQGRRNHEKTDRILEVAAQFRTPVVIFTEGGGGRASDGGQPGGSAGEVPLHGWGLDLHSWRRLGQLCGRVPTVAVNSGYCFAGNAALLGMCDVVIATANSSIGMGGPAMIEGGGLGTFAPEEVGPMAVQRANGVVDLAVEDEAAAVRAARLYLSYFQGPLPDWTCADQRLLRHAVPENRLRVYDVREVVRTLADTGSVLELRPDFGPAMVTALIRVEGRPMGVVANNPLHLSGAIDAEASDKAVRFMELCDAFGLPIVFLCDTPGILVGPEAEKTGLVRRASRLFVVGANLRVPTVAVVLRKGYGLGAMTMAGGSFKATQLTVAWPTGEFGGMGLEGMVRLGARDELEAIADAAQREDRYRELVTRAYQRGKALNIAAAFGIDDVIDPADTRTVIRAVAWRNGPSEAPWHRGTPT